MPAEPLPPTNLPWELFVRTPGIGVGLINTNGDLLYLNEEERRLFEGTADVEYEGKNLKDFHNAEFVKERLELVRQVAETRKPIVITHIYDGRRIQSTLWPIEDEEPPHDRVLVVSRRIRGGKDGVGDDFERYESEYIDLGKLDILSPRELEVLVLLGHGQSIPEVARILHRSQKTIEKHRESIGRKLTLRSQSEIVRIVWDAGLELSDISKQRLKMN